MPIGHAGERADRLAALDRASVSAACLRASAKVGVQNAWTFGLERIGAAQARVHHLHGRKFLGAHRGGHLDGAHLADVVRGGHGLLHCGLMKHWAGTARRRARIASTCFYSPSRAHPD